MKWEQYKQMWKKEFEENSLLYKFCSWLFGKTQKKSGGKKMTNNQKEMGKIWISKSTREALKSSKENGESYSDVLIRLLKLEGVMRD